MSQGKAYILSILFIAAILSSWVTLGYQADKVAFHLAWFGNVSRWVEIIALGWTLLGDGWFAVPVILAVAVDRHLRQGDYRHWQFWVAMLMALILPQVIKSIAPDILRPWGALPLESIVGLDIATMKSFPSGHTAAGVFTWGYVAMGVNRRWMTAICVVLGVGVAWSRMALNMHWSWDVIAGALLAVFALALIDRIKTN